MDNDKVKNKGFNPKDAELITKFIKGVTNTIEAVVAAKKSSDRLSLNIAVEQHKVKKEIQERKKARMSKYFADFKEIFIHTPIDRRQRLIELNEAKMSTLIIEAKVGDNHAKVAEYEQQVNMIIMKFIPLINKMQYIPKAEVKGDLSKSKKTKTNSFNLSTRVSYENLNKAREELIREKFIANTTTVSMFRSVFSYDKETVKVDWKVSGHLYYFINEMMKIENLFQLDVSEKWKVTAECFTVKSKAINSDKFRKDKPTQSEKKKSKLDVILLFFKVST